MIERTHAKLSASGSEKWMTCTPSADFEEQFEDEGSEFSKEGTFAHELLSHRRRPTSRITPSTGAPTCMTT